MGKFKDTQALPVSDDFQPEYWTAGILHFVSLHKEKVRDQETAEEEERVHGEETLLHRLHGQGGLDLVHGPDWVVKEGEGEEKRVS